MQQLVLGEPPFGLRRPVLLAGFGGWGDAGSIAYGHGKIVTLDLAFFPLSP